MNYRNEIIAELTQLENYARTCFVIQLELSNGQGKMVNEFIDQFMADLTGGELVMKEGVIEDFHILQESDQITLDTCVYILLPDCREAVAPKDCAVFALVADWIHDNLHKCEQCGEYYNMNLDGYNDGLCPACHERADANDPATVADFQNDLDKGDL